MNIFSIAVNIHDHNWYDGNLHYQAERYTRKKHNLNSKDSHDPTLSRIFFAEHFIPRYHTQSETDLFAFTVSNLGQQFVKDLLEKTLPNMSFLDFIPENLWDRYHTDSYYYIDHHQSHAAYAFLTSGFEESDILAIDGRGWQFTCIFVDKTGKIIDLSETASIGGLWNRLAQDLGMGYLGAGKVMGLAAYGKYNSEIHTVINLYLETPNHRLSDSNKKLVKSTPKEDVAYTLQYATEELVKEQIIPLKTSDNICVAGGVAYNGYVNEMLTKYYEKVHVPPAIGDEGQSIGTYMHADYVLNRNIQDITVYAGQEYNFQPREMDSLIAEEHDFQDLLAYISKMIADGKIIGWYQGNSESGNRALGNRSILADPRNPDIKDIINRTIKKREDFRPFAPAVLEEHYQEYFETNQPSPFMSRIVPVISDKIPGITHVDGTARIQTVNNINNSKFYSLINEFYKLTGVPILLNTSFNCQEPIVETPEEAIETYKKTELDILVIDNFVISKNHD